MDDLLNSIRVAQVRAAEDLVCESLRGKGLLIEDPLTEEQRLTALRNAAIDKLRDAEKAAYAYFCACPVGRERERAADVYENIRNAARVG